ncbi:hypothetical protein BC833DRAFT_626659, partial [Globomyces pollinis-pini]
MQSAFFSALLVASASALPQTICPAIFAPVCGSLKGVQTTYSNDCVAKAAGAKVLNKGECAEAVACPMIFAPVCGTLNGVPTTYSNDCVAKAA